MSFIDYGNYLKETKNALVEFALNPFLGLDNSGTIPKNPVSAISDLLLVRTRSCSLFDHIFQIILGNSKVNIYKCSAHEPRVIIMLLNFVQRFIGAKKGSGFHFQGLT